MLFGKPIFNIFLFLIFYSIVAIIFFSAGVVLARNPVHSVLSLILAFCFTTVVFLFFGLEFVAITFLVVYVGAIAVLFLFVVMMLNIRIIELDESFWNLPIGLFFSLFFLVHILPISTAGIERKITEYGTELENNYWSNSLPAEDGLIDWLGLVDSYNSNTLNLAVFLYTYNFYLFILMGLILLVAMVGSIALVLSKKSFVQPIYKQILRKPVIGWMSYSDRHTQQYLSKIYDDLKNF